MILIKNRIVEFTASNGSNPFRTWLSSLPLVAAARVQARLYAVEIGNLGDHKSVGDDVFELRIHMGPGYRVYFGRSGTQTVIVLCGGTKRSQWRDIAKAKRYWTQFTGDDHDTTKR